MSSWGGRLRRVAASGAAAAEARTLARSRDHSSGVMGADAAAAKARGLQAAESAAANAAARDGVVGIEMVVQQWCRTHYSALLPELRKWELRPNGCISYKEWGDSLVSLGFPATGKWEELQALWQSWAPMEGGVLHWQAVRNAMAGGRLIKVQQRKHTVQSYYKQPSRAGEGFGNRSSPRFREEATSLLGPGKCAPPVVAPRTPPPPPRRAAPDALRPSPPRRYRPEGSFAGTRVESLRKGQAHSGRIHDGGALPGAEAARHDAGARQVPPEAHAHRVTVQHLASDRRVLPWERGGESWNY